MWHQGGGGRGGRGGAATIKLWHQRGYLKPLSANRKPVLYRVTDVQECAFERMPQTRRDALDALWAAATAQTAAN